MSRLPDNLRIPERYEREEPDAWCQTPDGTVEWYIEGVCVAVARECEDGTWTIQPTEAGRIAGVVWSSVEV